MLLKQLSNLDGAAGDEGAVRNFIKKNIKDFVDTINTDALGNLICYKRAKKKKPVVLIVAHMDEVGFIITGKKQDGTLKFSRVGGISPHVILSKTVRIGKKKIKGIIGVKPIHLLDKTEAGKTPEFGELYIDVGATSDKEIEDISIGDYAYFDTAFEKTTSHILKGKAFDDRIGCSLILDLIKSRFQFPLYAVFTTQEEIGLRGACVIGNRIKPDFAIILEGTGAGDFPSDTDTARTPFLGKGPTLTVIDRSMIADREFLRRIKTIAEKKSIPYQMKQPGIGGTDAGRIHISQRGVTCGIIAVPARYIHSPVSLMNLKDYKNSLRLAEAILRDIGKMEGK